MNVIWTYYCTSAMLPLSHDVTYQHQSFTNPLPWPHGMIAQFPLYAHFSISPKEVGHPVTFCLSDCELSIVNSDILLSCSVFHLLYSRDVCDFRCSPCVL